MKILHTSDLHIGKKLEKFDLYNSHSLFFEFLIKKCEERKIDIVVVAGDIFNVVNPDANSERLFYKYMKKIVGDNERLVIINAGNHDNAKRLGASIPLAIESGIIIIPTISDIILGDEKLLGKSLKYDNFEIYDIDYGVFRLKYKGEDLSVVNLGYPSEENINYYRKNKEEIVRSKNYRERVKEIFYEKNKYLNEETFNLAIGHLYINGSIPSDSESDFNIGGIYGLNISDLPQKADYIALGHLHKKQIVGKKEHIVYSGSPIAFSKSEANFKKYIIEVEFEKGELKNIEHIEVEDVCTVSSKTFDTMEKLINYANSDEHKDKFIYLQLNDKEYYNHDKEIMKQEVLSSIKNIDFLLNPDTFVAVKNELYQEGEQKYFEDNKDINIQEQFFEFAKQNIVSYSDEVIQNAYELFVEYLDDNKE